MATRSQVVGASHLGYLLQDTERMNRIWQELSEFTLTQKLRPIVGHEFKFHEMAQAHSLMESRQSQGKIVLQV